MVGTRLDDTFVLPSSYSPVMGLALTHVPESHIPLMAHPKSSSSGLLWLVYCWHHIQALPPLDNLDHTSGFVHKVPTIVISWPPSPCAASQSAHAGSLWLGTCFRKL